MSFSVLGLTPSLCTPLVKLGYNEPTPVQVQAIPVVLTGRDLLARAQTGTGKTAAFGLPMIDRLMVRSPRQATARKPRGLVLVPTRELAKQVELALAAYGAPVHLRVASIFGGVSLGPQKQALSRGLDIVVATPGRLLDHMQQRTVDLSCVEILVLDEADRMLDMGFIQPLRKIVSAVPRNRQTMLLSATLDGDVMRFATDFTRDPARVDASPAQTSATTVTHRMHPVPQGRKADMLTHVLKQTPTDQAIVFCKTKHGSNRVGEYLTRTGVKTAVIHGNKSQSARHRALGDFKAGRAMVLVATDIAARGLDIAQLPLVVNYDLPLVAQDYIHRVGRTGRAGFPGRAVSLVSHEDRSLLADIQKLLSAPIERVAVDGFDLSRTSDAAPPSAPPRPHVRQRQHHHHSRGRSQWSGSRPSRQRTGI